MQNDRKEAIIIDIDGTLANCDHRRHFVDGTIHPKDWKAFYEAMKEDAVNAWCKEIISNLFTMSILVSGRPEEYRGVTLNWLQANKIFIPGTLLFMRKSGDYRDDTIIKEEIYREHIEPHYNVLFVIDDRDKVVRMWRKLGLVALHCADGDF